MKEYPVLVSISILNYNTIQRTIKTIDRLKASIIDKNFKYEIIVVDNGSNDNSASILEKTYQDIVLIKNKENRYFSVGHNQAASAATGKYILILNSDLTIEDGVIENLYNYIEDHPLIGGVSSGLYTDEGEFTTVIWKKRDLKSCLLYRNPFYPILAGLGILPKSSGIVNIDLTQPYEAEILRSAIFLISSELFNKIKGYDERILMYTTDDDLCMKIRNQGYKLILLPFLKTYHDSHSNNNGYSLKLLKIIWHDYFWYSRKYLGLFSSYIVYLFGAMEYYSTVVKRMLLR